MGTFPLGIAMARLRGLTDSAVGTTDTFGCARSIGPVADSAAVEVPWAPLAFRAERGSDFDAKRLLDFVVAVAATILCLPLILLICGLILLSGRQPISAQRRAGRHGRMFDCYKFCTVVENAPGPVTSVTLARQREKSVRRFKRMHEPRITRLHHILRRSSLDALPQLFNVLKGDISLMEPRPAQPSKIHRYSDKIDANFGGHPGMTGLSQTRARNLANNDRPDTAYERGRSLKLGRMAPVGTVHTVLSGRPAC